MLFNSVIFIFIFLPITFLGFFLMGRYNRTCALIWLTGASLVYYSFNNFSLLGLILFSVSINYCIGTLINNRKSVNRKETRYILIGGVLFNLLLLGYFKYANFFVDNLNAILQVNYSSGNIILPIGISFFTFTQIAYLVDISKDESENYSFLHYCLFVTIFPHLIAGPIIHHKEIIPQFSLEKTFCIDYHNLSMGLTFFFIGLFKKVCLADPISYYVNQVFELPAQGITPTFYEAWIGAIGFTFQLYFDFSGYCDMAIGLALMFNIFFPLNFSSPYKSTNIVDFWHTWHMTLSRFLRDYVYIPLGGNRKGKLRKYCNLMITMLLGGVWHGANWTFICWGGIHGILLTITHAWRDKNNNDCVPISKYNDSIQWLGRIFTFIIIIFLWVLFRAKTVTDALNIWAAMIQLPPIPGSFIKINIIKDFIEFFHYPVSYTRFQHLNGGTSDWLIVLFFQLLILLLLSWFFPNSQEIMGYFRGEQKGVKSSTVNPLVKIIHWKPNLIWFIFICIIALLSFDQMENIKEFLYYQF